MAVSAEPSARQEPSANQEPSATQKQHPSTAYSAELSKKLQAAYQAKGKDYKPRTEHFNKEGAAKYTNRLILEESPYLIQHAHNPVNWYAWSKEAFEKARKENKPVFLSIGYSTCHWCHVMEKESFDNEAIAAYLNEHYIAIKVDRERRPDVDKIYMTALMIMKQSGGWPMSSILTPDGKPFYSGTYFPPDLFIQVLEQASQLWRDDEENLRAIAEKITLAVQSRQRGLEQAEHIGKERVQIAVINLMNSFDDLQGGFSAAPKFPNETYLFLLLDVAIRDQDEEVLQALISTMNHMAQGGIYDQVGGGFHRYATDNEWLVPHFEKMLYNQAHLVRNYLQLYRVTQDENYHRVVTQTLDYVLREMRDLKGGFFSASDADSEGEEGKFFVWSKTEFEAELTNSLGSELSSLATAVYGVTKDGNFSEQAAHEVTGNNILYLPESLAAFSQHKKIPLAMLYQDIDKIRDVLYKKRQSRIAPTIDHKVLTAWNGMMITAFAQAGKQLDNKNYLDAAIKAADYLWQVHHVSSNFSASKLLRVSLDGKASVTATLADYAYLIQSYLALFDATENQQWLQRSQTLMSEMLSLFWDKEEGAFYMSALIDTSLPEHEQGVELFDRPKDIYDGAIPSANAVALEGLTHLYLRTGEENYHAKAMALIASLSSKVKVTPSSFSYLLMAVNQLNFGELSDVQYGGKGHVKLEAQHQLNDQAKEGSIFVDIKLNFDEHWHINSRYPKDEDLQATSITLGEKAKGLWKITRAEYPQGEMVKLKFNDTPLSLYQNSVTIKVLLEKIAHSNRSNNKQEKNEMLSIPLKVNYQTCSDKVCLAPESNTFYVFSRDSGNLDK